MKGEELFRFESVWKWFESLDQSALSRGKAGLSDSAKRVRLGIFLRYTNDGKINPDTLLEEAKKDIDKAGERLNQYFQERVKSGISWNTACTEVSFLRGFYTHNNLFFPKKYRIPKRKVSKVSKRDSKTEIYGYDEENGEIVFRNGTLQHFVQNLSFRDQTIALCLLSTGADATDLLKLNVDFVKDAKGDISKVKRYLWHGNREKTGTEFKVYFSEEATEFLKRFVEQERSNAIEDEPLFAKEDSERLDAHALAMNFRVGAKKMGYTKKGQSSPFRPKRFRHLFRTACGNVNVDAGYTMAFMGHASNVSASYLEKSSGLFLKEYIKVEPYVTVFGVNKAKVTEMTEEIEGLKSEVGVLAEAGKIIQNRTMSIEERNTELEKSVKSLSVEVADLRETLESAYDHIEKLTPILETFNEFAEMPAFQEWQRRMWEEKEEKLRVEAEEATRKERAEIMRREKKKAKR